jgi:O-acetyl-ADP-ribose deacetylase (regulator of RNase III)
MPLKIILVDVNTSMIDAWRNTFEENPEVQIAHGSILDQAVNAWVSPTNSHGRMRGGLDAIVKKHLGDRIETMVQQEISRLYLGVMPIGCAVCVPTGLTTPQFLIMTPTMGPSKDNVSDTFNVALACAAALQAAHLQNRRTPNSIDTLAIPGLGASSGKVPVEICADLMWTAYNLFQSREFPDYFSLRAALEEQLGDLGSMSSRLRSKRAGVPPPTPARQGPVPPPVVPPPSTPSVKQSDVDFDDA